MWIIKRSWAAVRAVIQGMARQKPAEEALLRRYEGMFEALLQCASEGIVIVDREGCMVLANGRAEEMFGYDRGELLGKAVETLVPEPFRNAHVGYRADYLSEPRVRPMGLGIELSGQRKDGRRFPIEIGLSFMGSGNDMAVICVITDISKRKRAEEALRESEARYRELVEAAPDLIYTLSPDGTITSLNPALETITGWTRDEWLGKHFAAAVHPDDLPAAMEAFRRVLRGEVPSVSEYRLLTKSGGYVTVELLPRPLVVSGKVVGTLGIARDTTARKRAEEALRESEARFRRLSEAAFEAIVITDEERILDANEQFVKMFGYDLAEVIGMHALEFTAPESRDLVSRNIKAQYEKPYEPLALRKDGSIFPVEVCGKSIPYKGRTVRVTAIRDITERKRAQEALRESEARYRDLVENINDVIFEVDTGGRITYVSPVIEQLSGYSPAELIGRSFAEFVHLDDLPPVMDSFQRSLSGNLEPSDYRILSKSGETGWVRSFSRPILEGGRVVWLRGVLTDITRRKRAEEALERAREKLEAKVERQLLRRNPYGLTFRELTVLHLVAAGRSDREIGIELGISPLTAQKHISNILSKMEATSRTEAGVRAVREGLID